MAHHNNYWTCSPFADWLRGTPKGSAKDSYDWYQWDKAAKSTHPVRYWLAEEGLGHLQDVVTYPIRKLYDLKYYINNRWVTGTHSLTAHSKDIAPGQWCDVGNRFLPCLFNELVDFVEVESAMHHVAWGGKEVREEFKSPFWAYGWFRWRTWRCPAAGIAHFTWAAALRMDDDWVAKDDPKYGEPTYQAIAAQEILDLYSWWTTVYPTRPDAHKASGWSAYCDASRESNGGKFNIGLSESPALKKMSSKALKLLQKIEAQYEKEDADMMIRLIKIRNNLWT